MISETVHTSAAGLVRYHEQHLSNGDYHLAEGKTQGEFIGVLAEEWGLSESPILKDDPRFRAFAELNIDTLSGEKLEMITTRAIIEEEQAIIDGVQAGMGKSQALVSEAEYYTPAELRVSYDGLAAICEEARVKGEEMTGELATLWLQQHEAVNRYVMTSSDRFQNIRGGAGVGKTYFMERLVRASLDAGRPVALVAPYGEQSRAPRRGRES